MIVPEPPATWRDAFESVRDDVLLFYECLNFEPTDQQRRAAVIICKASHDRCGLEVAIKSGRGTGKSTFDASIALWRTFRSYQAETYMTSATFLQVKDALLKECRRLLSNADPWLSRFFDVRAESIVVANDPNWAVKLMSPKGEVSAGGRHNLHLTQIGDEASGIMDEVTDVMQLNKTQVDNLLLLTGNPTSRKTRFFRCFNEESRQWQHFTWDSRESPHVTPNQIQRVALVYGIGSPMWNVSVEGRFPDVEPDLVITEEDFDAMVTGNPIKARMRPNRRQIGIDLARRGGDESVVIAVEGYSAFKGAIYTKAEPLYVLRQAMALQDRLSWKDCLYVPDSIGLGEMATSILDDSGKEVFEFRSNNKARDSVHYHDRATEAWFRLRKIARSGMAHCIADSVLKHQLTTRTYEFDAKGRFIIESKDDWRRDKGDDTDGASTSPDRADALVMAMYDEADVRATAYLDDHESHELGSAIR